MTRSPTVAHERPILFSAAQVRAVLGGVKTQHRQVVKPQPITSPGRLTGPWQDSDGRWGMMATEWRYSERLANYEPERETFLPFKVAAVGDRLWVRESIGRRTASFLGIQATNGVEEAYYLADGEDVVNEHGFNLCPWWERGTLPSIHMPRWASRITLEVREVRVQRLQDISERDARAEGVVTDEWLEWREDVANIGMPGGSRIEAERDLFARTWNTKTGSQAWDGPGSWDANPWVTAITFRRIDQAGGGHA